MALRVAGPDDAGFVRDLWTAAPNADFLDPPQDGSIEDALADGTLFIWDVAGEPAGFALLVEWVEDVFGLMAFATTRPGIGRPFLVALLNHLFHDLSAHRVGLDVTADNARALRFFQAAGFVREGVWREGWRRPRGDWVDCVFMGLLDREWPAAPRATHLAAPPPTP
jgi:RimJ/RimL family protein N-acetyltransferase